MDHYSDVFFEWYFVDSGGTETLINYAGGYVDTQPRCTNEKTGLVCAFRSADCTCIGAQRTTASNRISNSLVLLNGYLQTASAGSYTFRLKANDYQA